MTVWNAVAILADAAHEQGDSHVVKGTLLVVLAVLTAAAVAVGVRDVLRFSPSRLWALASQTFRESVRKRVLLLIPAAMVLIVAVGMFQRGFDQVDQIHQATELCIRVSSTLTLLLVILLAAFSLPKELESRTIYTLLSKPVTRLELLLGKIAGLWLVAVTVLAVMGAFSYGYLRVRAGQLIGQARAAIRLQQAQWDEHLRLRQTEGPAATQPDGDRPQPLRTTLRREPPDAALQQQVEMGLLTAMNYVEAKDSPRITPQVPAELAGLPVEWSIPGRGYLAFYEVDLPPVEQRSPDRPADLRVSVVLPGLAGHASPRLHVQLCLRAPVESGEVAMSVPPAAIYAARWTRVVGETMTVNLRQVVEGLWQGQISLAGDFLQALGPADQIGIILWPRHDDLSDPRQLVGFLTVGDEPPQPQQAQGVMMLWPDPGPGRESGQLMLPRSFRMFPRGGSLHKFIVGGASADGPIEDAEYTFTGLDRADLRGDELVFELRFDVEKGSPVSVPTTALIEVVHPRPGGESLKLTAYPSTRRGSFIRVPKAFADGGAVRLRIRPGHEDDAFGLRAESIRLLGRPTSFAANLLKSLLICAMQAAVVVGIGVMASVFLSWPVALLLTGVLLVTGNLLDVVRGMLTPHAPEIFTVTGEDPSADLASKVANEFLLQSSRIIKEVVPDFGRFDPVAFIGRGLNIPLGTLWGDLYWVLLYVGPALVIGYLTLRFKEVAR